MFPIIKFPASGSLVLSFFETGPSRTSLLYFSHLEESSLLENHYIFFSRPQRWEELKFVTLPVCPSRFDPLETIDLVANPLAQFLFESACLPPLTNSDAEVDNGALLLRLFLNSTNLLQILILYAR